jgi:hypothetical protein
MRGSIAVDLFTEHHWHDNVREDELSRTNRAIWGVEKYVEREHSEDLDEDDRTILNQILGKWGLGV